MKRCPWGDSHPLYIKYHDKEWGVPVYRDRKLFEFLILEGAQAGLSWLTILKKRDNYRKAYDNWDFEKIAKYDSRKVKSLLGNTGIIRNRLKIRASITNARAFIQVRKEFGSFSKYMWKFMNGKPRINKFRKMSDFPAKTRLSDQISKDLIKRGFKFLGSTICYAHMQATGMVNDHIVSCFRYKEVQSKHLLKRQ